MYLIQKLINNRKDRSLRSFLPMTTKDQLGHCPQCGEAIPATWKLIEYEREDGTTGVFAECPTCEAVVKPEN